MEDLEVVLGAVDHRLLTDASKSISRLLRALSQHGNGPSWEISFCRNLKSVRVIINLLEISAKNGENIQCKSEIEEVYQFLRDLFDQEKAKNVLNDALELLRSVCKLCAYSIEGVVEATAKFYLYNVHLTRNSQCDDDMKLRLRLLSVILNTLVRCENRQEFRDECGRESDQVVESNLLVRLILQAPDSISVQVLLTILPNYVVIFDAASLYLTIWNESLESRPDESTDGKVFSSLCYLFDIFAARGTQSEVDLFTRLLQDEKFWKTLQRGLINKNNVIRRQALYLMKRSVQELFDKDLTLNSYELNELSGANFVEKLDGGIIKLSNGMKNFTICNNKVFMVSNEKESVMWWHPALKNELSTLFNDVFLVYETLDEKQAHIVKPVFQTMIRLLGPTVCPFRNGKRLHISWILTLFHRILSHDNASVVRWGLINMTEIDCSLYKTPHLLRIILNLFVAHLNNPSVFVNEINVMGAELKRYFSSAASSDCAKEFFQVLIDEICAVTWSPETLFIVIDSLHDLSAPSWGPHQLQLIKTFVKTSIATHYTFLRASIQCHLVDTIIRFTEVSEVNLEVLADVMGSFRGSECLQRGSAQWLATAKWIEYCFSKRNAEEFIVSHVPYRPDRTREVNKVARMICLLYDAHLFGIMKCCGEEPSPQVLAVLSDLCYSMKDMDKRLYADPSRVNYNLELICGILRENLVGPERSHLVEIMLPHFSDILAYIISRSDSLSSSDYPRAQVFIDMVEMILKGQIMFGINSEPYIHGLLEFSLKSLGVRDDVESGPMVKYVSLQYLKLLLVHVYNESTVPALKAMQKFFKNKVNVCLDRPDEETSSWGKINAGYLEAQWRVISRLKDENLLTLGPQVRVEQFLVPTELAENCMVALQLGSGEVLIAVMDVVQDLILELEDDVGEQLVNACWSNLWDLRRREIFTSAARKFISMLFQPELVNRDSCQSLLRTYSSLLLTESVNGVANAYLTHIQTMRVGYRPRPLWEETLASALVFGGISKREDRLTQQVAALIAAMPGLAANDLVQNDWNTNGEVRARAVQMILCLTPEKHSAFADKIADNLLAKDLESSGSKSRSFAGSSLHLIRTRVLQALLVLEPVLSKEKHYLIYDWLCGLLLRESQQPSARYLTEWLIVRLLLRHQELQIALWANFSDALEQRIGSLCSFMSVVYHALSVVPVEVLENWLDRAISQFLPYCLAQHFSLRLYAQVAIEKMWHLAESKGFLSLLKKYRVIRDCQLRSIGYGNAVKNIEKLRQDFYWTVFHPVNHYSLQTIFRDLPRLSHLKPEEWITLELFSKVGVSSSLTLVPWSTGDDLWSYPVAVWSARSDESSLEVPAENFQKKLIPVKSLLPDFSSMLDESLTAISRKKTIVSGGLVVVASLVDRAANIGGLCRTCEAFGVSELVIDSLQILEDKQFQVLSVTSDKWVHITEIKAHYLSDYILKMKEDGYTVVGAEQTTKSVALQEAVFPKKTLLLLGSEKEGVPPQLLSLLDVCVEVPQFGVIRSLNVHVTGSLFIWEYVKQHSLQHVKEGLKAS